MAKKHKTNTKQLYCVSGKYYYTNFDMALKNALDKLMQKIKQPYGWKIRLVPQKNGYRYEATQYDFMDGTTHRSVKIRIVSANSSLVNYTGS